MHTDATSNLEPHPPPHALTIAFPLPKLNFAGLMHV